MKSYQFIYVKKLVEGDIESSHVDLYENAKNLIADGKVEDTLKILIDFLKSEEDKEKLKKILSISAKYKQIKSYENSGLLERGAVNIEINKIISAILDLVDE